MTSGADNNDFGSVTARRTAATCSTCSRTTRAPARRLPIGKMDANFTILSQTRVLKDGAVPASSTASRTSDGGFLAVGNTAVITQTGVVITFDLIRLDSAGTIVWQKQLQAGSVAVRVRRRSSRTASLLHIGTRSAGSSTPPPTTGCRQARLERQRSLWDKTIGGADADTALLDHAGQRRRLHLVSDAPSRGSSGWARRSTSGSSSSTPTATSSCRRRSAAPAASPPRSDSATAATCYVVKRPDEIGRRRRRTGIVKLDNRSSSSSTAPQRSGEDVRRVGRGVDLRRSRQRRRLPALRAAPTPTGARRTSSLAKTDGNGAVQWARAYGGAEASLRVRVPSRHPDHLECGVRRRPRRRGAAARRLDHVVRRRRHRRARRRGSTARPARRLPVRAERDARRRRPGRSRRADHAATVTALADHHDSPAGHDRTDSLTVANAQLDGRPTCCTSAPALSATAAADKTSGTAPLTVAFTGAAANGTPPYTWEWDFGDGTAQEHAAEPQPHLHRPGQLPGDAQGHRLRRQRRRPTPT